MLQKTLVGKICEGSSVLKYNSAGKPQSGFIIFKVMVICSGYIFFTTQTNKFFGCNQWFSTAFAKAWKK